MPFVDVNVKNEIHELIILALEKQDWEVENMVTLLANEIKFVVREYES